MSETKSGRGRILLVVSLALNVFFVGTVVGGTMIGRALHLRSGEARHAPPIHSFASPRRILHEVKPEDRKALVKQVRSDMKALRPLLNDVGTARRAAIEAMRSDTFDTEATLSAFEVLVGAEAKAHGASNQTLVRMLASLSDEERKRVVGTLRGGDKRRHRPIGEGRRQWSGDPGPERVPEPGVEPHTQRGPVE